MDSDSPHKPRHIWLSMQSSIHASLKWQDGGTPVSKWTGLCIFSLYLEFTALQWITVLLLTHVSTSPLLCACLWSSSVFQLCKLTLDRHWNTTGCWYQPMWFQWHPSVLVAPVVFQCGMSSGIPLYWQNLVWKSLGQVTCLCATPNVYNWYGESCLC